MNDRDVALLVHLAGVVFLFSGMSIAGVAHAAARGRERPSEVALLLELARTGVPFVGAGGLRGIGRKRRDSGRDVAPCTGCVLARTPS